jgi:N-acetylglucosamine-6-sulfatase
MAAFFVPAIVLAPTPAVPQRNDIIVILTDDMRADDWSVLTETTQLVGGTWYPNFVYTTPLCCPTRATIQRGQFAHNTGMILNERSVDFVLLDDDTIATALDKVGYHTIYVGKYMNYYGGRAPGWDVWQPQFGEDEGSEGKYWIDGQYGTDLFRDQAVVQIAEAPSDQPMFLMIGFHAPHNPAKPALRHMGTDVGPTANRDDQKRKRTLLAVDEAVVAIADAMGPRWNDACVLVLSDNGFLLREHGTTGKSHWWDEATRVPLRARCDGLGSGTDTRLAATIDIAPTILHAAGADVDHALDGQPLQALWDRDGILIESWDTRNDGHDRLPFAGIKGKDWVYVEPEGDTPRFYKNPGETENIIGSLDKDDREAYVAWLAELKACAGSACQAATDVQFID